MVNKELESAFVLTAGRLGWQRDETEISRKLIEREKELDWSFITTQLYRHRLMGLGWRLLAGPWREAGGSLPRGYALYETWYRATVHKNDLMRRELERLAAPVAGAGVGLILRRGPALIGGVYDDLGVRPMSDIDLLVRPEDGERFIEVLSSLGYVDGDLSPDKSGIIPRAARGGDLPRLLRLTGDTMLPVMIVDPSNEFSSPAAERSVDIDEILKNARLGQDQSVGQAMVMSPHHMILDLCGHVYEESTILSRVRRGRFQRILQYVDILAAVNRCLSNWDVLLAACENSGFAASVYYALGNAQRLFTNGPVPDLVLQDLALMARAPEGFLDQYGAAELLTPERWPMAITERMFTDSLPAGIAT
jgi:hypothetical protein